MTKIDYTDINAGSHCVLEVDMQITPAEKGYTVDVKVEDRSASGWGATYELAEQEGNEIMAGLVMEVLYAS